METRTMLRRRFPGSRARWALLLVLAFVSVLLAPARVSWACPDGTPCVEEHGQQWVCAGGRCRTQASCCRISRPCRCKHGAFPGAAGNAPGKPGIEAPDHCRYSVFAAPHFAASTQKTRKLAWLGLHVLPPPVTPRFAAPRTVSAPLPVLTAEIHPPPLLTAGPSRAPPHTVTA